MSPFYVIFVAAKAVFQLQMQRGKQMRHKDRHTDRQGILISILIKIRM
jgi:hypothetical protein